MAELRPSGFDKLYFGSGRLYEYASLQPGIESPGGVQLSTVEGRISFRDVHFSYPTRPEQRVLDGFNLTVEPGQTVALCGASGSGKSTAIALLERFYDPDPMNDSKWTAPAGVASRVGAVELDGYDIRTLDLRFLRGCMSLVSQEPRLFAGSVAENISCESTLIPVEFKIVHVCSVVAFICWIYSRFSTWRVRALLLMMSLTLHGDMIRRSARGEPHRNRRGSQGGKCPRVHCGLP